MGRQVFDASKRHLRSRHKEPDLSVDSRRDEALSANPDNAEEAAERQLRPTGRGSARKEALGANPDVEAEEAARRLPTAGYGSRRAEALGANPDTDADEARRLLGRHQRR
jgi:hypothetical protein